MTVVVATILCDRKSSSQLVFLPGVLSLDYPDIRYYINIETNSNSAFDPLRKVLIAQERPYDLDCWSWHSTWWHPPAYDQDQSRLTPIVIARNMCLNFARAINASHILFVDADVKIQPDGLKRLLVWDKPIIGGYVPGRGAHKFMHYLFNQVYERHQTIVRVDYGTCGYMLLRRDIFEYLSFRWGKAVHAGAMLSEDPAYANDAKELFGMPFWIDTAVTAEHWDDPEKPFTENQQARF